MTKIAQNTKGNLLYFNSAIDFLTEKELISLQKGKFEIVSMENLLIPPNINELIAKRLEFLAKDKNSYDLFAKILLFGEAIDLSTIKLFKTENEEKALKTLCERNYIQIKNNIAYVQNYNLYKENFLNFTNKRRCKISHKIYWTKLLLMT